MAAADVANYPRISFGLEDNAEMGWQSPRISFSLDLSLGDRHSPDSPVNADNTSGAVVCCDSDFEFCLVSNPIVDNGRLSSAEELFGGGKILPLTTQEAKINAEPQICDDKEKNAFSSTRTLSRNLSLDNSSSLLPDTSPRFRPSTSNSAACPEKKPSKPPNKWKEIFKVNGGKDEANADHVSLGPQRSRWPFSRSCSSSSGETRLQGGGIFCSIPFARSHSSRKQKSEPGISAACCGTNSARNRQEGMIMEEEWPLVSDSDPEIPQSIVNDNAAKSCRLAGKADQRRKKVSTSKTSTARGRNLDRSTARAASPRPGRAMKDGNGFPSKMRSFSSNRSASRGAFAGSIGIAINPVLNVPICIRPSTDGNKRSGFFVFRTFFSSRTRSHKSNTKNNGKF